MALRLERWSLWWIERRICPTGRLWASKTLTALCDWAKKRRRLTQIAEEDKHRDGKPETYVQEEANLYRDQELRFIVHESPDYYRLKCSVFNDDKKTDMIGEAWLDLNDLIKPGGGQNDLWHQLNFKGKYAGDIRVEMTYYDTRPNPELEAEKRKQSERTSRSEIAYSGSAPRQLGPREIKRRPLPPGPIPQQTPDLPQPLRIPPRISQSEQMRPSSVSDRQLPPRPALQQHWSAPESADDYDYNRIHIDPRLRGDDHANGFEPQDDYGSQPEYDSYHDDQYFDGEHLTQEQRAHTHYRWSEEPMSASPHSEPSSPFSTYDSSPPVRQSPPAMPEQPSRAQRMSASAVKYNAYRDSPLRQSMSQHEMPILPPTSQHSHSFDLEPHSPPPPPPPVHRNSAPRPATLTFNTPPRIPFNGRPASYHPSVENRSPLQALEQQYNPDPQSPARPSGRRLSAQPRTDPIQQGASLESAPGSAASVGEFPAPHQLTQNYGVDFVENPVEQDRQGRYVRRNSATDQQPPYSLPVRARTFEDDTMDGPTYRSEPQLVRPRAVSPNDRNLVQRKSVSPQPHTPTGPTRHSGIPYGPDSYDTPSSGSSPALETYDSSNHARETARQEVVARLQDRGPIIGNDGRVIDPSDHLPSDTWAPEPERKDRKPEHVINIRRKGDGRHPRADSSPMPLRHTPPANPPLPSKPSSYQNSGADAATSTLPSEQRRNRLQKQMPARPLPTQPFQHPHSSPGSIPQVRPEDLAQTPPRRSMPPSPHSGLPSRPPMSAYQVPMGNSYNPRGSYHPNQQSHNPQTSSKMPPRPQSYAYGGYEDPLAAEMSMIDIGPPRGGRTALRSSRGYEGY